MSGEAIITKQFLDVLAKARSQVLLGFGWELFLQEDVIDDLLKRDLHVVWLVGSEQSVKKDFSIFNQLLDLKKRGVELRLADPVMKPIEALIDQTYLLDGNEGTVSQSHKKVENFVFEWKKWIKESTAFFPEDDDILIDFNSSNSLIFSGDEIEVQWDVTHATAVELVGVSEVDRLGTQSFKLGDDSFFKIKASNALQTAYATLFVGVNKQATVEYDLEFQNFRSGGFNSLLRSENHKDVYGVARDSRMRFTWSVSNCESVLVNPFGSTLEKGEYEFEAKENVVLEITTKGALKEFSKKIHLFVFPLPVEKNKVDLVKPEFLARAQANVESTLNAIQGDPEVTSTWELSEGLMNLKKRELKRYKKLVDQLGKMGFDGYFQKFHPKKLDQQARVKLREMYHDKPDYLELINRLDDK